MATLIDGKKIATDIKEELRSRIAALADLGVTPALAVVLVGQDPASQVYVRNKRKTCESLGIRSIPHDLPADTSEGALLALVDRLNADPTVDGILVQMPLPPHVDSARVLERIDPHKDVDGFHPTNVGLLVTGAPAFVACTAVGVVELLERTGVPFKGQHAVVIGRSNIVGKPVAHLLLARHCTVTICHSRTRDLPAVVRQGDIVVAAVGKAQMVRGDWIKPGAAVIDVGINRDESGKLVGDVAFDEAFAVAGSITPVPGGVGPMTIAMLMSNTVWSAERRAQERHP
ncbi:MAG: bifunctional protein FolD [Myxococcales bacterium]